MAVSDIGKSVRCCNPSLLLIVASLLFSSSGNAQYSASFQTNTISGVVSNWAGDYFIGGITLFADVLMIESNGVLSDAIGYIGSVQGGSNCSAVVTGSNSVWANSGTLYAGNGGANCSLVVSNGGQVISSGGIAGRFLSASNDTVLVTDTGSVWSNGHTLYIGSSGAWSSLLVSNGGQVVDLFGGIGEFGDNNHVLVSGAGSTWRNIGGLVVGSSGSSNSLVINNGGVVVGDSLVNTNTQQSQPVTFNLGRESFTSNNWVLVTGPGSVLSNANSFAIGGSWNRMIITNGGKVVNANALITTARNGGSNSVRVVDNGVWECTTLTIGNFFGPSNSVVVAGGSLVATNIVIGYRANTCDNLLQLSGGNIVVTNAAGNAVLEVRYGKLVLNGGTLRADILVMTNGCGQFVHTGGTLIVGSLVLDPNLDADGDGMPNGWEQTYGLNPLEPKDAFSDDDGDGCDNLCEYLGGGNPVADIKSIKKEGNDIRITWKTAGNQAITKTNALQRAPGGIYDPNAFVDIFVITNYNGAVTNYLDTGGATNKPALYYRVRLVP